MEPTFTYSDAILTARDLFAWFERRILPNDRAFVDTDLSVIAAAYLEDAMSIDQTPNITTTVALCGVVGDRAVLGITKRRAADEIRELSRSGLDFTVVRRNVMFGGREIDAPTLPMMTKEIFEITSVRLAGLQKTNNPFVLGATPQGVTTPLVGEAGGVEVPVVQLTFSESAIQDEGSAISAAETRWDLLHRAPTYISGKLLESAPVEFNDLIPGAIAPIRQQVGFRTVDGSFRLVAVDDTFTVADSGITEDVTLTFEPLGSLQGA